VLQRFVISTGGVMSEPPEDDEKCIGSAVSLCGMVVLSFAIREPVTF